MPKTYGNHTHPAFAMPTPAFPRVVVTIIAAVLLAGCTGTDPGKASGLLESGDFLAARRIYSRVVERSPGSFVGHYGLGMTWCAEAIYKTELGLAQPQDWYHAIYHISLAANLGGREQVRTTLAVLHFNLGARYRALGDNAAAIGRVEQALTYDSALLKALNLLGAMYHERGDLDNAEKNYRRAVAVRPDYAMAHFNLGALSWARGDYGAARTHFEKASALDSASVHFRAWLGRAIAREPASVSQPGASR